MQISKTLLVVCTAVCCAGSISFAAPDSLSEAQAREALRQKIAELNAQQPVAETPAPVTKPAKAPKPAKQSAPAVVAQPPAVAAPAALVVTSPPTTELPRATSEQLASQREALRQKIAELNAQEQAGQPAPAPATVTTIVNSPDTKSADVVEAERAAVAAAEAKQAKKGKTKSEASTAAKSAQFAPLQAPPSAVTASKEARLNELLSQYRADTITPEEYHKARANILAEP